MLLIPNAVFIEYDAYLKTRNIPLARFTEYRKWLRYYLDFCDKYPVPESKAVRVRLFCEKLKDKKQPDKQREQAAFAVSLYFEMLLQRGSSAVEEAVVPGNGPVSLAVSVPHAIGGPKGVASTHFTRSNLRILPLTSPRT